MGRRQKKNKLRNGYIAGACARITKSTRREREKVIVMQKSQFSGRLGAMRCDTRRCRAIIITTDDIIPVEASTQVPAEADFVVRSAPLMHF